MQCREKQEEAVQLPCLGTRSHLGREKSQAVPEHGRLQPRSGGNKKSREGTAASSHLLRSCGIAVALQWFFHLLSTSLTVIPVNPLRDPWELLSVRAQILLFPVTACSHLLEAHSPPEHWAAGQPGSTLQGPPAPGERATNK